MWVGSEKSIPIRSYQAHVWLFIWVVVIGPILVSIDLIALAMAMVISAEQPVMPVPWQRNFESRAGHGRCCSVACVAITILYIVYVIIYIYTAAHLSENVQSVRELPLKDLSGLAFAMRFAMGCDQMAFVEFDCMTFGDLREFWHFFCRWFPILHWNFKFENTPAFHAEALYAATYESHGPWVLYECLGVSVRWGVLIIFDIVLRVPSCLHRVLTWRF